ncbi:MAG: hypothetical protein AAF916_08420 [Planctomycetota bacterium]
MPCRFPSGCIPTATVLVCLGLAGPGLAVENLLTNPGFNDTDDDPVTVGDGWGAFGAASFNAFFGANPHGSLFPDTAGNTGGFFQLGISATPGSTYQFDLLDTRIESNFDADLKFGLEYWSADDGTGVKLGETLTIVDAAERLALSNVDGGGNVNGAVFSIRGTAVPGATLVRPIVSYDNVNTGFTAQSSANVFVFDAFLSEVPAPGGELLKNPGFEDLNVDGNFDDNWSSFGAAGFGNVFGTPEDANGHASLFGDTVGNAGGIFQQSQIGEAGIEYRFELGDVRLDSNWNADLIFGLEYYASDDFTKLGESLQVADTSVTGDGLSFSMTGTAVPGTAFVRPVIQYDNVDSSYLAQSEAFAYVFEASLSEAVASMLAGDFNGNGNVEQGDLDLVLTGWGSDRAGFQNDAGFASLLIDQEELDAVLTNWGGSAAPSFAGFAVPEPAAATALVGLGLAGRQRRVA